MERVHAKFPSFTFQNNLFAKIKPVWLLFYTISNKSGKSKTPFKTMRVIDHRDLEWFFFYTLCSLPLF